MASNKYSWKQLLPYIMDAAVALLVLSGSWLFFAQLIYSAFPYRS